MKVINIKWDVDNLEDLRYLPHEFEIPDEMVYEFDKMDDDEIEEQISDYISDFTGFCHRGFELAD